MNEKKVRYTPNCQIIREKGPNVLYIFSGLSNEDSFTSFAAEIVDRSMVLITCGKLFIHFYSTDGVGRHRS